MTDLVVVKDRKGAEIGWLNFNLNDPKVTVGLLKQEIFKLRKITPIRQWLTIGEDTKKIVLDDNQRELRTYPNFQSGIHVTVKDLGPQLSWTTVFYAEYLGPIIFYGIFFIIGSFMNPIGLNQKLGLALGVAHYAKRLLETHFVHIFSHESMPLASCWKNFLHYWIFFGTFVGVEYFMFYSDPNYSKLTMSIWIGLWAIFQFLNFKCHQHLAGLRSRSDSQKLFDGSSANKQRQIPHGWGFDQVSCANYLWETLAWVSFSGLSRCYAAYFFTAVSFYQMFVWALAKQRRYKKEFGESFPKGRKAIIPFII